MITEERNLGYDASKHELIVCKTMIWEEGKETAEEFLDMCKDLYPNEERSVHFKRVEVILRTKSHKIEKEIPNNNVADDFYGTKSKKKRS